MAEIQDQHWWFERQRMLIKKYINNLQAEDMVLDLGCGTGANLILFPRQGIGLDREFLALQISRNKGLSRLVQADAHNLPFKDETFAVVIITQVLYHQKIRREEKVLQEVKRVLRKGGRLLLAEPAFEILRREHDRVEHTRKRYQREEIRNLLEKCGFRILKISYLYPVLFPVMLLRKLYPGRKGKVDLYLPPSLINTFLLSISHLENFFLSFVSYPIGSSIGVLAIRD